MRIFKNRLFLAFIGIVFLSLFFWFIGPLIGISGHAPLESTASRISLIGGMFGLWFLIAVFRFIQSRRKNAKMLDSLAAEQGESANDVASREEMAILQEKMQDAVSTLKNCNFSKKGGSRFIYELPWYAIIGPPGAGKTTLLSNSGLQFPLEETHGKNSIKGVGGTRNCDWWFTDQAVLLDTAGRYTTQDSESEVDRAAWQNFLKLLREKRKRRPLNGIMIAISLQDVLQDSEETLQQTAHTIRTRVDELYSTLGIAPPVYLIFTKCDLLAGFSEFFADLNKESRDQVWGFTMPLETPGRPHGKTLPDTADTSALMQQELKNLGRTLGQQSIEKLHRELSVARRENIYGFPLQFSYIQKRLHSFTQQLGARSRLLENVVLRGVYFTSATQTGSVFDQVIETISEDFGVHDRMESPATGEGKSFFIRDLLEKVIFSEAGLAGTNLKTERRLKQLQIAAGSVLSVLLLGLLATWGGSYARNSSALDRVDNTATQLHDSLQNLSPQDIDLLAANNSLNHARALAVGAPDESESGFLMRRTGLYQGDNVNDFALQKYDELLIDTLLPRLMVRLEHQMAEESTNSEFLFEALKTYQMIDSREHFDSDAVTGWFNFDLNQNLPPETTTQARESLRRHIAHLFRKKPVRLPRPIDRSNLADYQRLAANLSIEERAYNRIKREQQKNVNAFYRVATTAGPETARVFSRSDGLSLDQSISSFYTREAYQSVFLRASESTSKLLADDSWVLGEFAGNDTGQIDSNQLQQQIKQLYYADYIRTWEELIGNLALKKIDGFDEAAKFLSLITDSDSPLKSMLVLIASETTLTSPPANAQQAANGGADDSRESKLSALLGNSTSTVVKAVEPVIDPVTSHFRALHELTDNWETNASRLDATLLQMAELNLQLLPMAQSPTGAVDPALSTELAVGLQKLDTRAERLAEPMASLVKSLSNEISDVAGGGFCQQLDTAWKADVYGYYQRAIKNRYPVNRKGTADIALTDFGAFFGRGGLIDQFVETYLATQVSKTPGQWTWVGKGKSVCLSDNTLKQLAFAEEIKNTFFTQSGNTPSFRFDIVTDQLTMSPEIELLSFNVGSSGMEYFHGPVNGSTSFVWPDVNNNNQVSLRVSPVVPGTASSKQLSGPWAILRLFDQGNRNRAGAGLNVSFSFAGRPVSMTLATSSFNPLNSVAVRSFRAPESL